MGNSTLLLVILTFPLLNCLVPIMSVLSNMSFPGPDDTHNLNYITQNRMWKTLNFNCIKFLVECIIVIENLHSHRTCFLEYHMVILCLCSVDLWCSVKHLLRCFEQRQQQNSPRIGLNTVTITEGSRYHRLFYRIALFLPFAVYCWGKKDDIALSSVCTGHASLPSPSLAC